MLIMTRRLLYGRDILFMLYNHSPLLASVDDILHKDLMYSVESVMT